MRKLYILLTLLTFFGCKREDPVPEVKPLLMTGEVKVGTASTGGIVLSGEFIVPGSYRNIQYGFQIDAEPDFSKPIELLAGSENQPVSFTVTAPIGLKPENQYFARAWARTDKYAV